MKNEFIESMCRLNRDEYQSNLDTSIQGPMTSNYVDKQEEGHHSDTLIDSDTPNFSKVSRVQLMLKGTFLGIDTVSIVGKRGIYVGTIIDGYE